MLDVLEQWGIDVDRLGAGQSEWLHSRLFPGEPPQTICAAVTNARWWSIVWVIGFRHCARHWEEYHS